MNNIFVELCHGSEEVNKPMRSVKENEINRDVLGGFIIVQTVNVKQPSLQPMFSSHTKKHALGKGIKVKIDKQEKLKFLILIHLMHTPKRHVLLLEFLLPLPIER